MFGFAWGIALAVQQEPSIPSAREAYVGCYLMTRENDVPLRGGRSPDLYSAASCLMLIGIGFQHEAGKPRPQRNYCIEGPMSDDTLREMAQTYVSYYEANPGLQNASSVRAMTDAFARRWPCRS